MDDNLQISGVELQEKEIDFITLQGNKIEFSSTKFIQFIEKQGISKVKIGLDFELVLVKNFIVEKITPSEIKGLVLYEVKKLKNDKLTDYLLSKTMYFSMKFLDAVKTIDLKMHRDKIGESYYYYRNGVVKVTAHKIFTPIPYKDFRRLIWKDHIIDRDFNSNVDIEATPPVFQDFITKLSNSEKEHFYRICSVMGYCLFDFKTAANSRAVVINDMLVSSKPEGGSGKSLIVEALSKVRKTSFFDGKNFNPKAEFAWQKVDETFRIVCIDDVKRGFDFEELFSLITSGFRNINKKNKSELELSVEDSPMIILTSNYILKGASGSFARRQHTLEVYPFFSKKYTPIDEYDDAFFSGWDDVEWSRFDVFMLSCVQLYLKYGVTEYTENNVLEKQLIRSTNQSFAEWMEDYISDVTNPSGVGTVSMRDKYLHDTNQKKAAISERKFTDYIKSYCEIFNYSYHPQTNQRPRGFKIVKNDLK